MFASYRLKINVKEISLGAFAVSQIMKPTVRITVSTQVNKFL